MKTDAEIVNAVISSPTNKEAARVLGMSESQLYLRMQSTEYRDLLNQTVMAQTERITGVLREKLLAAIDAISEIAENTENPAAVRLNAANSLVAHYLKMSGMCRGARNNVEADRKDDIWRDFMTP